MKTCQHFLSHLAHFFLKEMFHIKVFEKIKTHILCSVTLFENRAVYEKMWTKKTHRGGQDTDGNRAHSHCMLDN